MSEWPEPRACRSHRGCTVSFVRGEPRSCSDPECHWADKPDHQHTSLHIEHSRPEPGTP